MFNLGVNLLYEFQIVFILSSLVQVSLYIVVCLKNHIVQEESKLK